MSVDIEYFLPISFLYAILVDIAAFVVKMVETMLLLFFVQWSTISPTQRRSVDKNRHTIVDDFRSLSMNTFSRLSMVLIVVWSMARNFFCRTWFYFYLVVSFSYMVGMCFVHQHSDTNQHLTLQTYQPCIETLTRCPQGTGNMINLPQPHGTPSGLCIACKMSTDSVIDYHMGVVNVETEMSCWWNFYHLLHRKLSKFPLPARWKFHVIPVSVNVKYRSTL